MDETRQRHIAARQVTLRTANARTVELLGRGVRTIVHIMCECGRIDCERMLAVTTSAFEKARASTRHFLVAPHHGIDGIEFAIKKSSNFWIVEKIGVGAELAERPVVTRS